MILSNQRNKLDHAFAIMRIDESILNLSDIDNAKSKISVIKVMDNVHEAEDEVRRLNLINGDDSCRYFYKVTRLKNN